MLRTYWTARSAMEATSNKMDQIAQNITNFQTDGYKKTNVSFKDLVYESMVRNGYPVNTDPTGSNPRINGTGVKATAPIMNFVQGDMEPTYDKADIALDGEGFLKVTDPNNQTLYSRGGTFMLDAYGRLVDSNTNILNIKFANGVNYQNAGIKSDNYSIDTKGNILVENKGVTKNIGTLEVYNAVGNNAFTYLGANLYLPTKNATVFKTNKAAIYQGLKEKSNVNIEDEETDMITTQRAFQFATKSLQTADTMMEMANNLKK